MWSYYCTFPHKAPWVKTEIFLPGVPGTKQRMGFTTAINNLWTWSHWHEDWWDCGDTTTFKEVFVLLEQLSTLVCPHNLLLSRRLNSEPSDNTSSGRTEKLPLQKKPVQTSCSPGFSISAHPRSTTVKTCLLQKWCFCSKAIPPAATPQCNYFFSTLHALLYPCLDAGEGVGLADPCCFLAAQMCKTCCTLLALQMLKALVVNRGGYLENKKPNKWNLLGWGGAGGASDSDC